MKPFAISLSLLLLFPAPTLAGTWPQSDTPAGECEGLNRACSAAAKELKAARALIAGYERQVSAADERIRIAERQIETWKEKGALETLRASELEKVIAAEREIKADLLKKIDLQKAQINRLEKQLGRARKFTLVLGVAAAVGILIAVAK